MLLVVAYDCLGAAGVLVGHEAVAVVDLGFLGLQRQQDVHDFPELLEIVPELLSSAYPR